MLVALILITVMPVVLLGYLGARDNTDRLMRDRSELVLDLIVEHIARYLDPVSLLVEDISDAVHAGSLNPEKDDEARVFATGALAGAPQAVNLAFRRRDGNILHISRGEQDLHRLPRLMPAAVRQSLDETRTESGVTWFGPFWSPLLQEPVLGLRASLRGPANEDRGALVVVVSISDLSAYLAKISTDIELTPFVLIGRDGVLAHPSLAGLTNETGLESRDPTHDIATFEDPVLARIWSGESNPLMDVASFRRSEGHWSWFDKEKGLANAYVFRTIFDYGPTGWIIGFHYPGSETQQERATVLWIGLGGLAVVGVAVGAAVLIGRRMGEPLLGLADAAARVQALDFRGVRSLPRGPVREVNQAATALEHMAVGLARFETYLPKTLVRRLMAAGPASPLSESREVTVMFTDLEAYTRYSDARPAGEVVDYLNDLLSRVGPMIEASGGTIDKYIGDSVMAFWGAPEEVPYHARDACRAALAIVRVVEVFNGERRGKGLAACRMRIGLHTGVVSVGNVGFAGRVDYTIIGQTVNIAQSLEQAGRAAIGDDEAVVLVSGSTKRAVGDDFVFSTCQKADELVDGRAFRLVKARVKNPA